MYALPALDSILVNEGMSKRGVKELMHDIICNIQKLQRCVRMDLICSPSLMCTLSN